MAWFPHIFSSHMILQQEQTIQVWEWASPRERVTVTLGNNTQRTLTDKSGKWMVSLPPMKYGGPFTMTITGKKRITLDDVLVGEVWICSGQSNMGWPLVSTRNAAEEIASATFPEIRLFTVPRRIFQLPLDELADVGETGFTRCIPIVPKNRSDFFQACTCVPCGRNKNRLSDQPGW